MTLVGGRRPRRRWQTGLSAPQELFPIANRPILLHNLQALRSAGLTGVTILVDPDHRDEIERAVREGGASGLTVRFGSYVEPDEVAAALAAASALAGDGPVLLQQGAALLHEPLRGHISTFAREGTDVLALQLRSESEGMDSVGSPAHLLSPGAIELMLERPGAAADPIAAVRAGGGRVRIERVHGCLPCQSDRIALLEANRRLLEGLTADVDEAILDDCEVQGAVAIHPSASLERTLVRGPAVIGAGARLVDAYVGPYSSIGADVVIEGAEVEHSIVLAAAELRFVGARLESSVIGEGARIVRGFGLPSATQVSIGDGAEVVLA